jgi:hypothetical protein
VVVFDKEQEAGDGGLYMLARGLSLYVGSNTSLLYTIR